jgi:hypothetical protein
MQGNGTRGDGLNKLQSLDGQLGFHVGGVFEIVINTNRPLLLRFHVFQGVHDFVEGQTTLKRKKWNMGECIACLTQVTVTFRV